MSVYDQIDSMPIFSAMAMIIMLICGAIILNEAELYLWYELGLIFVMAACSASGIALLVRKPDDPEWLNTICDYVKKFFLKIKTKLVSLISRKSKLYPFSEEILKNKDDCSKIKDREIIDSMSNRDTTIF